MTDHIGDANKKVTAVEWLFIQLYLRFEMKGDGREMDKVLEQAKEKNEKEMMNFANWCRIHDNKYPNQAWSIQQLFDKYHNEIYGK